MFNHIVSSPHICSSLVPIAKIFNKKFWRFTPR